MPKARPGGSPAKQISILHIHVHTRTLAHTHSRILSQLQFFVPATASCIFITAVVSALHILLGGACAAAKCVQPPTSCVPHKCHQAEEERSSLCRTHLQRLKYAKELPQICVPRNQCIQLHGGKKCDLHTRTSAFYIYLNICLKSVYFMGIVWLNGHKY